MRHKLIFGVVCFAIVLNTISGQYNSRDGRKTRYPGRESTPPRSSSIVPTIAQVAEEYWIQNSCEYPPKDFYPLFETACDLPPSGEPFITGLCQAFFNSSQSMCHLEGYGEEEKQTVASITALQATIDDDSICDTLTKLNDQDPQLFPLPTDENKWFKAAYDILFSDLCSSACSFSRLHPLCFGFLLNYDVFENKKVEEYLTAAEGAKRVDEEDVIIVEAPNLENSTELDQVSGTTVVINEITLLDGERLEEGPGDSSNKEDENNENDADDVGVSASDSSEKDDETPNEAEEVDAAETIGKTINPKFFPFKDTDPNFFVDYDYGDFFDDEILNVKDRENLVISDDIYKDREFITKLLDLEEDILSNSDGDVDLFDGLVETPKKKRKKKPYPTALRSGGLSVDDDFSMLNLFLLVSTLFLILAAVIIYNHRRKPQRENDPARRILQPGRQPGWNYERVVNDEDEDGYHN